jgi:hypothetical protein
MNVRILASARDDLIEGYHFYEELETGLGRYFLSCLYSDIERLAIFGGSHAKVYGKFHRANSNRFPFAVYNSLESDSVLVRAVVDCRRSPSWIRRHVKDMENDKRTVPIVLHDFP